MSNIATFRLAPPIFAAILLAVVLGFVPAAAVAAPKPVPQARSIAIPGMNLRSDSLPWTVVILLTVLTLLPALLLSMTPFASHKQPRMTNSPDAD